MFFWWLFNSPINKWINETEFLVSFPDFESTWTLFNTYWPRKHKNKVFSSICPTIWHYLTLSLDTGTDLCACARACECVKRIIKILIGLYNRAPPRLLEKYNYMFMVACYTIRTEIFSLPLSRNTPPGRGAKRGWCFSVLHTKASK